MSNKLYQEILWRESANFSQTDTQKSNLYVQIYPEGLRYWVSADTDTEVLYWKDYQFLRPLNNEEKVDALRQIYASDVIVAQETWAKIIVQTDTQAFSLIPKEFFEEDSVAVYLKHANYSPKDILIYAPQQRLEAINVFVVSEIWKDFFSAYYPKDKIRFCHPTQVFIESVKENLQNKNEVSTHILVEKGYVIVVMVRNDQIEFCNVFNYNVANDILYYLTTISQTFNLNRDKNNFYLYGKINPSAEIFILLEKYFAKLHIQKNVSEKIKIDIAWEKLDFTPYFDLLGMCFI